MSKLFTKQFSTSLIDALYNEIVQKNSNYYYFLGKAEEWRVESYPPVPVDNEYGFGAVRKSATLLKKIRPTDIVYLVPRIDWTANTVYDMYDDRYGTEIIGVNIIDGGSNYSNTATSVVFTGDGANANATVIVSSGEITAVILDDNGIGYTTANVSFTSNTGTGANAEVVFAVSDSGKTKIYESLFYVLTDEFNVYKCIDNNSGTQSNTKPTLVQADPFTTADGYKWKFMFNMPSALKNKFLTADHMPVLTALNSNFYSNGAILSAIVLNRGEGYTAANTYITVEGDGFAEGSPRRISGVTTVAAGDSFTTANLTVEPPFTSSNWTATTSVTFGTRIKYESNIYLAVASGITGNVGPSHVSGTYDNGNVRLKFVGNVAKLSANVVSNALANVAITDPGFGYSFTPNVTITGGANANVILTTVATTANLTPIISGGQIVGVQIDEKGTGYTYAAANVIGDGSNAEIFLDLTTGKLDTLQASVEQLAVDGAIYAIKMISNGYDYTTANVTIVGNGSDATANATISNGRITSINITNPGSSYREADIEITGDGKGASARAIISPIGGHGYNAIRELYSSNVGITSIFFKTKNKGLSSSNDYRRLGILKNLKQYDSDSLYDRLEASACWLITGPFGSATFSKDDILTQSSTGGSFLVVEIEAGRMLVISRNNIAPVAGSVITDGITTFSITSVEDPDVNMNSGDLIYILNKEAFTTEEDQLVTIRTVIGL